MEWLTADCERKSSLAARVKLPVRANALKARSCLLSSGTLMDESLSCEQSKQRQQAAGHMAQGRLKPRSARAAKGLASTMINPRVSPFSRRKFIADRNS